jgi:hypothetical protein
MFRVCETCSVTERANCCLLHLPRAAIFCVGQTHRRRQLAHLSLDRQWGDTLSSQLFLAWRSSVTASHRALRGRIPYRKLAFSEELQDMLERTRNNPNAIIYGTFYSYPMM